MHETILCTVAPSPTNPGPGYISVHDIQTGTSLASFKQNNATSHCTASLESKNGLGGLVMSAQQDKSILNVYNFQKDQLALKIVLPEKLTCIALDPSGDFCAGGSAQGRIYLWEIASGILYNAWHAHYRQVNVLRFTQDGAALVSGSEDSAVSIWEMARLLDDELQNDLPTPYCILSDHTLPVTDILCGVGPFPSCRILSASIDHSVKIWDPSTNTLLTTFSFPKPISHLAWDPTERIFFAASSGAEGEVYQVNLFRRVNLGKGKGVIGSGGSRELEAIGGKGVSDVIRVGEEDDSEGNRKRLMTVGQQITSLALSLTSTLLIVGTQAGTINIYDVPSHQLVRSISSHKGLAITYLTTMLRPSDLVGHVNGSLGIGVSGGGGGEVAGMCGRVVVPFERSRDGKRREGHEVGMILPFLGTTNRIDPTDYPYSELIVDHAFFVQPPSSTNVNSSQPNLQGKVTELESEVKYLREQLGKAKGVNDAMWENIVKKVVLKYDQAKEGEELSDQQLEERRRKRGRS
ncbi:hypothetical protein JAAARDRAFT_31026 [Jaapia argillacea MUCL 33604]|uniref:Pre-rRNA-processing protein IPI3 n=1 Tax=Jaapia argillacea MUCL 33604 TaxID=933084 RepID=A0A067Q3L7_9AGAM|nr:hypothetical protein JAAARDRAFT_31026 [Jaapia argillacea MUCL 33604]